MKNPYNMATPEVGSTMKYVVAARQTIPGLEPGRILSALQQNFPVIGVVGDSRSGTISFHSTEECEHPVTKRAVRKHLISNIGDQYQSALVIK